MVGFQTHAWSVLVVFYHWVGSRRFCVLFFYGAGGTMINVFDYLSAGCGEMTKMFVERL